MLRVYLFLFFLVMSLGRLSAQSLLAAVAPESTIASDDEKKDSVATSLIFVSEDAFTLPLKSVYKKRLDSIKRDIPLDYNEHVQTYIDFYTNKGKRLVSRMLGVSKYFFPYFVSSFQEEGVPEELKYLSIVESALNPNAVSHVGATGLWQFMFTTAKAYGLEINHLVDERKDAVLASRAAAAYFKDAYEEFGDWLLAIAAYNCGKGAVTRAIEKAGGQANFWAIRKFLPAETRNYVPAYIAMVYAMNCSHLHGIKEEEYTSVPKSVDVVYVDKPVALGGLALSLGVDIKSLQALNPAYKQLVACGTAQKPCRIVIPTPSENQFEAVYQALDKDLSPQEIASMLTALKNEERRAKKHRKSDFEKEVRVITNKKIRKLDEKSWDSLDIAKQKESLGKRYVSHKVRKGETLSEIAERFDGVTVRKIKMFNNLKTSKLIPGATLKIPQV